MIYTDYQDKQLSLLGFGNLIGVVYPIFGYASVPFLICLVINWHKKKKTL